MREIIKEYTNYLLEKEKNIESVKGYNYDLNFFYDFLVNRNGMNPDSYEKEKKLFSSFTQIDFFKFVEYCKEQKNSNRTIARKISAVKGLYKYLDNNNFDINKNILTFKFKYDNSLNEDFLTLDEYKIYVKYVKENESLRNQVIIFLILYNALNVNELCALKREDITEDYIEIKNEEKTRILFLNDALKSILSRFLSESNTVTLLNGRNGMTISKRMIHEIIKNSFIKSGIYKKGRTSQTLRKTCINMLKEYGNIDFEDTRNFLGITSEKLIKEYMKEKEDFIERKNIPKDIMNKIPF